MACHGRAGYCLAAGESDHHRVIAPSAAVFHSSGASKWKRNIKLAAAAGMGYARDRADHCRRAATNRLDRRGATRSGATTYDKAPPVKQRCTRSLMIYVVLKPRSPHVAARIVDPYLLIDRQSQAARYPQFTAESEAVVALAGAAGCGERSNCAPGIR